MKFRKRLRLLFIGLAVLTNGLLMLIMYLFMKNSMFAMIQSQVMSIAAAAAVNLDAGLHVEAVKNGQESEEYEKIYAQLGKIRNANRRDDVYVRFIYTLVPGSDVGKKEKFVFAVDAEEENTGDQSKLGDVFSNSNPKVKIDKPYVSDKYDVDKWGVWLTAYYPLRDAQGRPVALLGVDVRASDVQKKLDAVLYTGLGCLALSVLIALIVAIRMANRVSDPLEKIKDAVVRIGRGEFGVNVDIHTKDEFGQVADAINEMTRGLKERELLKTSLANYVSAEVANSILSSGALPTITGSRCKITVLFSDIRNFTTLSESREPEEVVALLNEYFERMIDIIFRHQGMLDKFIGDGILCIFGAPIDDPQQELHAVQAAFEMQEAVIKLRDKWGIEKSIDFRVGIGIHTGPAIVGNIGSSERMEYTAIGDTVNLASRLESASKDLKASIVISDTTYEAVSDKYCFEEGGSITVKGRNAPVKVYAVNRK